MPQADPDTGAVDWTLTTWEGARREQLRRWSDLTLEEIVRAQEEMQALADRWSQSDASPPAVDEDGALPSDSPTALSLLACSDEELRRFDLDELLALLIANEDRAPRNLIDECSRRGDAMVERLGALLRDDGFWGEGISSGQWWLRLHTVMILGLIPGERAGALLVAFMRRIGEEDDENLQDWLAGYWPALFCDKTEAVLPALRTLCEDRRFDWYMRAQALDAAVSGAQRSGEGPLEEALEWSARIAADESEDWDMRLCTGNTLLDFPRDGFRPMLEDLAAGQTGPGAHFTREDVEEAYSRKADKPDWERFSDPWEFYAPAAIESRQQRWREEDERSGEDDLEEDDDLLHEEPMRLPYVRETPKIGRNDPCPCGSGKKSKKCCFSA